MIVYYIHSRYIYVSPNLPLHAIPSFPICAHMFALCVHVSTSTLQIGSSVPFFSRFHINTLIYDTCFSLSDFILYDILWVHPCLCKWHGFFNTIIIVLLRVRKQRQKQNNISNILELEIRILDLNLSVPPEHSFFLFFNLYIINWRIITMLYWFLHTST